MATKKRTNYAKCKVWGDRIVVDMEGPILGCMKSMMLVAPKEFWQRYVDHLQKVIDESNADNKGEGKSPTAQKVGAGGTAHNA